MELLDQAYLNDLVIHSGRGDSNAFAELFAACWEGQYTYLLAMFREREAAVRAMQDVFAQALQRLPSLPRAGLFLPWISRMSYLNWREKQYTIEEQGPLHLSQILNLPLTESQILLMTFGQGFSDNEISGILNIRVPLLRRYRKDGLRHLRRESGTDFRPAAVKAHRVSGKPDAGTIMEILETIFETCGQEPNTVPMEALASYAVYRKERFSLQRGILIAGLVVFLLLPMLFLLPEYEVHGTDQGERGLPVYTIEVRSLLPVGRVTARLRSCSLPVYEAGAKEFTVEPTRNGTMTVSVELINRQGVRKEVSVQNVDAKGPELTGSEIQEGTLLLRFTDAGIGVDYREIYAVGTSGTVYYPSETNEETGEVLFLYPEEDWDVYVPDHIGNTLHLALTLQEKT